MVSKREKFYLSVAAFVLHRIANRIVGRSNWVYSYSDDLKYRQLMKMSNNLEDLCNE